MNYDNYIPTYTQQFLDQYYDYAYLKGMLHLARETKQSSATLITGSSHALCGIDRFIVKNSYNCSMNSQDLYYDFKCAKYVLDDNAEKYRKCYIVMGYYIPCQDLSKASRAGVKRINKVYYPLFGDAHNMENVECLDIHNEFELYEGFSKKIEKNAIERIIREGNYYNYYKKRTPYQDLGDNRSWTALSEVEKDEIGKKRANAHSKIKYKGSYEENKEIFRDYITYLSKKNIEPIVIVMPFTKYYNKYLDVEQKEMFMELLNSTAEDVHFVDFNEFDCFDDRDFVDTDHLNGNGAMKVSILLKEMFK